MGNERERGRQAEREGRDWRGRDEGRGRERET